MGKTVIFAFASILFLSACSVQDTTPDAEAANPMAGVPCHFMMDQWMGDCLFDSEGHAIDEDGNRMEGDEMPMMME